MTSNETICETSSRHESCSARRCNCSTSVEWRPGCSPALGAPPVLWSRTEAGVQIPLALTRKALTYGYRVNELIIYLLRSSSHFGIFSGLIWLVLNMLTISTKNVISFWICALDKEYVHHLHKRINVYSKLNHLHAR